MAFLKLADGCRMQIDAFVQSILKRIDVHLQALHLRGDGHMQGLLAASRLDDDDAADLLAAIDNQAAVLNVRGRFGFRDLLVLSPETPDFERSRDALSIAHVNLEAQGQLIVDGRGVFGFVEPSGSRLLIEVGPGDFIRIGPRVPHWFEFEQPPRIKAIRYFPHSPTAAAMATM